MPDIEALHEAATQALDEAIAHQEHLNDMHGRSYSKSKTLSHLYAVSGYLSAANKLADRSLRPYPDALIEAADALAEAVRKHDEGEYAGSHALLRHAYVDYHEERRRLREGE